MAKLKFFAFVCNKHVNCANAIECRALLTRINPSRTVSSSGCLNFCKLGNDSNRLQTIDTLSPKLCQWLECSQTKAEEIYAQLPKRKSIHVESVEEYVGFLKRNGVTSPMLLENPWLLLSPPNEIKVRMDILRRNIGIEPDIIPLLRIPTKCQLHVLNRWLLDAETFFKNSKFANRLHFFADNLHCSCHQVAMMMDVHHPLLTIDYDRIDRIMRLLLECGISRENIIRDMWIFRHNEARICERIERVRKEDVNPIKTWMLRCPEIKLENMLKNWNDKKDALGNHKDQASYLAERLQCSREDIIVLAEKYKPLLTIKTPKVKLVLDFLFENGFTADDVRNMPRVLGPCISTLESRLLELEKLGIRLKYLGLLYCTEKAYQHFISRYVRMKKID